VLCSNIYNEIMLFIVGMYMFIGDRLSYRLRSLSEDTDWEIIRKKIKKKYDKIKKGTIEHYSETEAKRRFVPNTFVRAIRDVLYNPVNNWMFCVVEPYKDASGNVIPGTVGVFPLMAAKTYIPSFHGENPTFRTINSQLLDIKSDKDSLFDILNNVWDELESDYRKILAWINRERENISSTYADNKGEMTRRLLRLSNDGREKLQAVDKKISDLLRSKIMANFPNRQQREEYGINNFSIIHEKLAGHAFVANAITDLDGLHVAIMFNVGGKGDNIYARSGKTWFAHMANPLNPAEKVFCPKEVGGQHQDPVTPDSIEEVKKNASILLRSGYKMPLGMINTFAWDWTQLDRSEVGPYLQKYAKMLSDIYSSKNSTDKTWRESQLIKIYSEMQKSSFESKYFLTYNAEGLAKRITLTKLLLNTMDAYLLEYVKYRLLVSPAGDIHPEYLEWNGKDKLEFDMGIDPATVAKYIMFANNIDKEGGVGAILSRWIGPEGLNLPKKHMDMAKMYMARAAASGKLKDYREKFEKILKMSNRPGGIGIYSAANKKLIKAVDDDRVAVVRRALAAIDKFDNEYIKLEAEFYNKVKKGEIKGFDPILLAKSLWSNIDSVIEQAVAMISAAKLPATDGIVVNLSNIRTAMQSDVKAGEDDVVASDAIWNNVSELCSKLNAAHDALLSEWFNRMPEDDSEMTVIGYFRNNPKELEVLARPAVHLIASKVWERIYNMLRKRKQVIKTNVGGTIVAVNETDKGLVVTIRNKEGKETNIPLGNCNLVSGLGIGNEVNSGDVIGAEYDESGSIYSQAGVPSMRALRITLSYIANRGFGIKTGTRFTSGIHDKLLETDKQADLLGRSLTFNRNRFIEPGSFARMREDAYNKVMSYARLVPNANGMSPAEAEGKVEEIKKRMESELDAEKKLQWKQMLDDLTEAQAKIDRSAREFASPPKLETPQPLSDDDLIAIGINPSKAIMAIPKQLQTDITPLLQKLKIKGGNLLGMLNTIWDRLVRDIEYINKLNVDVNVKLSKQKPILQNYSRQIVNMLNSSGLYDTDDANVKSIIDKVGLHSISIDVEELRGDNVEFSDAYVKLADGSVVVISMPLSNYTRNNKTGEWERPELLPKVASSSKLDVDKNNSKEGRNEQEEVETDVDDEEEAGDQFESDEST